MKTTSIPCKIMGLMAAVVLIGWAGSVSGETYRALKGVDSVKAVVDFRNGNPKIAAIHLALLHKTYNDANLRAADAKPEFVVIFMGPSVKLISTGRDGVTAEDAKNLDKIATILAAMDKDGIRLEVCDAAVKLMGVDPATLLPQIHQVPNGWISSIGYQLQGYALIPDF